MDPQSEGLLTDEERADLADDRLDAGAHRTLDAEVRYRIQTLVTSPDVIDSATAARIVADTRLLEEHGHNGLVSVITARLGSHLPDDETPR